MSDVTQILYRIESGNLNAAEQLLPLVFDELRKLAAARLAHEKPGPTLDGTALVHEAHLRLVGTSQAPQWNSRGHFFAAAAEAMRRILVEQARRKRRVRHGGELHPLALAGPDCLGCFALRVHSSAGQNLPKRGVYDREISSLHPPCGMGRRLPHRFDPNYSDPR
jgi:hypothetical protein